MTNIGLRHTLQTQKLLMLLKKSKKNSLKILQASVEKVLVMSEI